MEKLGVGIIGCGWVAEEHVKAFGKDPRSEVRALADCRLESAEQYRDKYGLKCSVGTDCLKAAAQDDVDIVVVCTPHALHTEFVVAAAEAGKHVLVEKPMAISYEEVHRQLDAVRRNNVKSLCSFVLHWNPLLMNIDNLIDQGALGNVFMVEVDYLHRIWITEDVKWYGSRKRGGTALLVGGCHAVDAMRWFARGEVEEVCAYQVKTENPIEYPGTISVNAKFDNGKIGRTTTSFDAQMPYRFNIGVYGTEGTVRNDELYVPKLLPDQNNFMKIPCVLPDSGDVAHHPFQGEAAHLLDCIIEDKRPLPDLEDAAKTHDVCFAADISAEEGRPVKLSELG